jgi:hypothetical protein
VARIWKAIQDLDLAAPDLAQPGAEEAGASEAIAEPAFATKPEPTQEEAVTNAQETPQSPDVTSEEAAARRVT